MGKQVGDNEGEFFEHEHAYEAYRAGACAVDGVEEAEARVEVRDEVDRAEHARPGAPRLLHAQTRRHERPSAHCPLTWRTQPEDQGQRGPNQGRKQDRKGREEQARVEECKELRQVTTKCTGTKISL